MRRVVALAAAGILTLSLHPGAAAHHQPSHAGGPPSHSDAGGGDQQQEPGAGEVSGFVEGLVVPEGETVELVGEVTSDANVVVYGTLKMRAGSSLTFVDVEESAFAEGAGDVTEPVESDVGLWVFGQGQLDVVGSEKQGWNRTGVHETWSSGDEYVAAPHDEVPSRPMVLNAEADAWELGDEVSCVEFAGEEYCTEIVNLTRDVTIQGTEQGKSHIYIRSDAPQTIRYAELRNLGPNGDGEVDGRYAIHMHHMHEGSRGSLIEGVVVRDSDDHAFVPHHSNGVTFRDTVAYNVKNTPYWWDERDETHDVLWDRALAVQVKPARDTRTSLSGFLMGMGTGNECRGCTAAGVQGRSTPSSGFRWTQPEPNNWVFTDAVSHNNQNGIWHWRNRRTGEIPGDEAHHHEGFVGYNHAYFAIEQGAYNAQAFWYDAVIFNNNKSALRNRAHPRTGDLDPGIGYLGGTYGASSGQPVIDVSNAQFCSTEDSTVRFEDLTLYPSSTTPIYFDHDECFHEGDTSHYVFQDVVIGDDQRDLTENDFQIEAIPPGSTITIERTDGTTLQLP